MNKRLVKRNKAGQIVVSGCHLDDCGYPLPHCFDCAFVNKDDIREIMKKLYQYERTGLRLP
jgi:hypothetical protein